MNYFFSLKCVELICCKGFSDDFPFQGNPTIMDKIFGTTSSPPLQWIFSERTKTWRWIYFMKSSAWKGWYPKVEGENRKSLTRIVSAQNIYVPFTISEKKYTPPILGVILSQVEIFDATQKNFLFTFFFRGWNIRSAWTDDQWYCLHYTCDVSRNFWCMLRKKTICSHVRPTDTCM